MCNEDDLNRVAADIMEYLQQRPMASDTLDGVVHWWLLHHSIMQKKSLVKQALEHLAEQGKVFKADNANREAVYSLRTELKPAKD